MSISQVWSSVIQFNVPFSNILFNHNERIEIEDQLDKIKNTFASSSR